LTRLPPVNTDTGRADTPDDRAPAAGSADAVSDDDSWKNKWIYVGGKLGIAPRMYGVAKNDPDNTYKSEMTLPFTLGVEAGIQPLNFLKIQIEADFSLDFSDGANLGKSNALVLNFPLLVKGVFKPGRLVLVEPYGGMYLNLPLSSKSYVTSPLLGWSAGVDFGTKAGPGIVALDFRFSMNLGNYLVDTNDTQVEFAGYSVAVTAGYRIGFRNRK
jgi:hypothetical protein